METDTKEEPKSLHMLIHLTHHALYTVFKAESCCADNILRNLSCWEGNKIKYTQEDTGRDLCSVSDLVKQTRGRSTAPDFSKTYSDQVEGKLG